MAITTAIPTTTASNSAGETANRIQGRQDNSAEGASFSVPSTPKQGDAITPKQGDAVKKAGEEKESVHLTQNGVANSAYPSSQKQPVANSAEGKKDEKSEEQQDISASTDPVETYVTEVVMTSSLAPDPSWSGRWVMPVTESSLNNKSDEASNEAANSEQPSMQPIESSAGLLSSDGAAISAGQFVALANSVTGAYESGVDFQKSSLTSAFTRTLPANMALLQQSNAATSNVEHDLLVNNANLQRSSSGPLTMSPQLAISENADLSVLTSSAGTLLSSSDGLSAQQVSSSAGQLVLPATGIHEWEPIKMTSSQSSWGQQLVETLKERVEMQINQNVKQAHIRLDPPELGKLELTVRFEGEKLSVQVNAANPALRDALLQSSDRLRMSLMTHHSGGVEVNVGQGDRQQQNQPQQELFTDDPVLAGRQSRSQSVSRIQMDVRNGLNALV